MSSINRIMRIVRGGFLFVVTALVLGTIPASMVRAEAFTDSNRSDTVTGFFRTDAVTGSGRVEVSAEPLINPVPTGSNRGAVVEIVSRVTSGNRVGLALRNDGVIGTGLASRAPSLEFPLGTGIEHLVRAGIWVGGVTAQGDTLVSTAATAAGATAAGATPGATANARSTISTPSTGSIGAAQTSSAAVTSPPGIGNEFLPLTGITERSYLASSPFFSEEARSEQDLRYSFADNATSQQTEDHRPLQVQIDVEMLQFSFEPYDAIVIMNCNIINLSETDPIHDLYSGLYTELATGFKDPDDPKWSKDWFGQKDIGFLDSLRLVTEHHFHADGGRAPTWAGVQLLGTHPVPASEMTPSFNWWNWEDEIDGGDAPTTDAQRYRMMSNGQIRSTFGSEAPTHDPVELLSIGPFSLLEPGDTVSVSFAWLGGEADPRNGRTAAEDIAFNAGFALSAFEADFDIPVPPPSPELLVEADRNRLTLRWTDDPEGFLDPQSGQTDFEGYRIYVSEDAPESGSESGFRNILEADIIDSLFYDTGLDGLAEEAEIGGVSYKYRYDITGLRDGFNYWIGVTSFDTGIGETPSLESGLSQNLTRAIPGTPASPDEGPAVVVFPNPYRGDAAWDGGHRRDRYLWFANLPERCTIRIYTLAGDLIDTIEFDQDYAPTDVRALRDASDANQGRSLELSGGMAAWDLVSRDDQGVASGLYMFSVEDHESGDRQLGKFLIVK